MSDALLVLNAGSSSLKFLSSSMKKREPGAARSLIVDSQFRGDDDFGAPLLSSQFFLEGSVSSLKPLRASDFGFDSLSL
jgi:hypothetical protein